MSDEDLVSLFDAARKKMDTMRPVDTVEETLSAMVHQNTVEVIPTWAEELRVEVTAIQKKLQQCSRTKRLPEETVFTVKNDKTSSQKCKFPRVLKVFTIDFLFDRGAKTSIMSVDDKDIAACIDGSGGNVVVGLVASKPSENHWSLLLLSTAPLTRRSNTR